MKKVLCLFLISVNLYSCKGDSLWFTRVVPEYNYMIDFPSEPQAGQRLMPDDEILLQMDFYQLNSMTDTSAANRHYMSGCVTYPDSLINSVTPEVLNDMLEYKIDYSVSMVNGVITSKKEINHDTYQGKEVVFSFYKNGQSQVITQRLLWVKNILYVTQVLTTSDKYPNSSVDKFLNSFQLND
jgi:hypothetical protein